MKLCTSNLRYKLAFWGWLAVPLMRPKVLNLICQQTTAAWSPASYASHFSETRPRFPVGACPEYCGFCESSPAHCRQGIVEKVTRSRKRRSRRPKCPSCSHNVRQSSDTRVRGTSEWICTRSAVACCKVLCNFLSLLVWSCHLKAECFPYMNKIHRWIRQHVLP